MRVHETIETCGPGEQSILKSFVNRLELALSGWFGSHKSVRWPWLPTLFPSPFFRPIGSVPT